MDKEIEITNHGCKTMLTRRQAEHIGDAIFKVAAAELCIECFGSNNNNYFAWVKQLQMNDNFGNSIRETTYNFVKFKYQEYGSIRKSDAVEIWIGIVYYNDGLLKAVGAAKEFLKTSVFHKKLVNFLNSELANEKRNISQD